MFEKLVEILKSYGLSVRYNDGTIYACKDIGKDALVFDILKFNDTFLVRVFSKDCEIIFSDNIDELYEVRRELLGMSVLNYNFDLHMVINSRWYWDCTIEVE